MAPPGIEPRTAGDKESSKVGNPAARALKSSLRGADRMSQRIVFIDGMTEFP